MTGRVQHLNVSEEAAICDLCVCIMVKFAAFGMPWAVAVVFGQTFSYCYSSCQHPVSQDVMPYF